MRSLSCFRLRPYKPSAKIEEFVCSIDKEAGFFIVNYQIQGALKNLSLRTKCSKLQFADELWKATVFEIFLRADKSEKYYEWNFCPSNRFAAYSFDSYRQPQPPKINKTTIIEYPFYDFSDENLRFQVKFSLPQELKDVEDYQIQLCAILKHDHEEELEYFALQHPHEKPDFHDVDCFQYYIST